MSVKVRSGHIKLDRKYKFKDLERVYEDLYLRFLEKSGQIPEDAEVTNMLVQENLIDIKNNRKPEGFNRQGKTRMIFPIKEKGGIEFYIYRYQHSTKSSDVAKVTESLSSFLHQKGFKHSVDWDDMEMHRGKK